MIDVVLCGLGRIGAQMRVAGGPPLNHLDAILATPNMLLAAVVDADPGAARRLGKEVEARLPACAVALNELCGMRAEVVVLATPVAGRVAQVEAALRLRPSVLLIEKPLAANLEEACRIREMAAKAGSEIRVNYHRRMDPGHEKLRRRAASLGTVRMASLRYGRGVANYASHFVDLMLHWFGPVHSLRAHGRGEPAGADHDPNLFVELSMAAGFPVYLVGVDGLSYDQFDADILFADGYIQLANGGIERSLYLPREDLYHSGYTQLVLSDDGSEDTLVAGFGEIYSAIASHLAAGAALPGCPVDDAVHVCEVVEAAHLSAARGGAEITLSGASRIAIGNNG